MQAAYKLLSRNISPRLSKIILSRIQNDFFLPAFFGKSFSPSLFLPCCLFRCENNFFCRATRIFNADCALSGNAASQGNSRAKSASWQWRRGRGELPAMLTVSEPRALRFFVNDKLRRPFPTSLSLSLSPFSCFLCSPSYFRPFAPLHCK